MRYNTLINNVKSKEWGLNLNLAYLFSWMYELPSWADKVIIENNIYYFASKTKACEELSLLTDKKDTMYRYYKQLEEKNLILIKKIDGKDYISLTEKSKQWNSSDNSEINPSVLGNKSELNSEINPTYNINKNNNINKDNMHTLFSDIPLNTKKEKKKSSDKKRKEKPTIEEVIAYFKENGYSDEAAKKAFAYYDAANWHDASGKPVRSWKQKMISVWFREENKVKQENTDGKKFDINNYKD